MYVLVHRKSSMERVIGASPFVGGLRGSSSTAMEARWRGGGKNDDRGNSKARGEKRLGVGGASTSEVKPREKLWIGLLVISSNRGDNRSSHSSVSRCGWSLLMVIFPNPKSNPPNLVIAELVATGESVFSSGLAKALSRAETLGVEFPRARVGVGGASAASTDKVGRCFTVDFRTVLLFSNFFFSMTFLKSFKENNRDMFGFTQRDFDCA